MADIGGHPRWDVHFDANGAPDAEGTGLPDAVAGSGVTDLFVLSHGWGTSEANADQLYTSMFTLIADAAQQAPALGSIGFVGVHWPSLWFPDPPPAAVAAAAQAPPPTASALPSTATPPSVTGAQIAAALAPGYAGNPQAQAAVGRLGELLDQGVALTAAGAPAEEQAPVLQEFAGTVRTLVTSNPQAPQAPEDAGEWPVISPKDPAKAYGQLSRAMGSTLGTGDAQGIGDWFGHVWSGAKDAVRVASYFEMKTRAGIVGQHGLGPLLERLHTSAPAVRVHLIGHSFGARLVAFSLAGFSSAQASPIASLSLVQGAFSHWSFSPSGFDTPGALAGLTDRVHGPLVATFSVNDWAVGRWYPKASLLSHQDNQDVPLADRWGGMGADGFQQSSPASALTIQDAGAAYSLPAGAFVSVDSSGVVANVHQSSFAGAHSDIQHPQVAWLLVSAATASS